MISLLISSFSRLWVRKSCFVCSLTLMLLLSPGLRAVAQQTGDYSKQWAEMESFMNRRLPESAKALGYEILARAVAEKNDAMVGKAWLQLICVYQMMPRDSLLSLEHKILTTIPQLSPVARALSHTALAELYCNEYKVQRNLLQTRLVANEKPDKIITWTARRFYVLIAEQYRKSLEQTDLLLATPSSTFRDMLRGDPTLFVLQPTLFDVLARTAIRNLTDVSSAAPTFKAPTDESWFGIPQEVVTIDLSVYDPTSVYSAILGIYQQLTRAHLSDPDQSAATMVQLSLLQFASRNVQTSTNFSSYSNAIKKLLAKSKGLVSRPEILFGLLSGYVQVYPREDMKPFFEEIKTSYPNHRVAPLCRQIEKDLFDARLRTLSVPSLILPGRPFRVSFSAKSVDSVFIRVIPVSVWEWGFCNFSKGLLVPYIAQQETGGTDTSVIARRIWFRKPVQKITVSARGKRSDYDQNFETSLSELPKGQYLVVVSASSDEHVFDSNQILFAPVTVSQLRVVPVTHPIKGNDDFYVLDNLTGAPVVDAVVFTTSRPVNLSSRIVADIEQNTGVTNEFGYYSLEKISSDMNVMVVSQGDTIPRQTVSRIGILKPKALDTLLTILPDRMDYQSGDSILFKVILTNRSATSLAVIPNEKVRINLTNSLNRVLLSLEGTTNEFGSFHSSFLFPVGFPAGNYILSGIYGSTTIRIAKVTKPSFEVSLIKPGGVFRPGDSLSIKGSVRTLFGQISQGDTVVFRALFQQMQPNDTYRSTMSSVNGILLTDKDGGFRISVVSPMLPKDGPFGLLMTLSVLAKRDRETQIARTEMPLCWDNVYPKVTVPEVVLPGDTLSYSVSSVNAAGMFVPAKVRMSLVPLIQPQKLLYSDGMPASSNYGIPETDFRRMFPTLIFSSKERDPYQFPSGERIFEVETNTRADGLLALPSMKGLAPGWYKISLQSYVGNGMQMDSKIFRVLGQTPSPIKSMKEWIAPLRTSGFAGQSAEFQIAGGKETSYVVYDYMPENGTRVQKIVRVGTTPSIVKVPLLNLPAGSKQWIHFIMVQEGEQFSYAAELTTLARPSGLKLSVQKLRKAVKGGERVSFTLSVQDISGNKVASEVAVSLYDSFLDNILPLSWSGSFTKVPGQSASSSYMPTYIRQQFRIAQSYKYSASSTAQTRVLADELLLKSPCARALGNGVGDLSSTVLIRSGENSDYDGESLTSEKMISGSATLEKYTILLRDLALKPGAGINASLQNPQLSVSGVFLPQLRSNPDGLVTVDFVAPKASARWSLVALAHTKDGRYGLVNDTLTTDMPLEVTLDLPSFFREGDTLPLRALVLNNTGSLRSGVASISFFDAATQKPIEGMLLSNAVQTVNVKPMMNLKTEWKIVVPKGVLALGIRVSIKSGSYTDQVEKERQVLRVPRNPVGIQPRDVPVVQKFDASKSLKLSAQTVHSSLWNLLLSAPNQIESPPECLDNAVETFYAATLAARLVGSAPDILKAQALTQNGSDTAAFLLALSKNPEVQTIIRKEAPWLLLPSAQKEKVERIIQWVNMSAMTQTQSGALSTLNQMRYLSQGFVWFPGFTYHNRTLCQSITADLIKLIQTGMVQGQVKENIAVLIKGSFGFLDRYWTGYFIRGSFMSFENHLNPPAYLVERLAMDKKHVSDFIQWLYLRSYSYVLPDNVDIKTNLEKVILRRDDRTVQDLGMLALILHRTGDTARARQMVQILTQKAIRSAKYGMYWKEPATSGLWEETSIVGTQTLMAEVYQEAGDTLLVDDILKGLLHHPDISRITSHEALDIVYTLLEYQDARSAKSVLSFVPQWSYAKGTQVNPSENSRITLQREYFIEVTSPQGVTLKRIAQGEPVKVGDVILVRITPVSTRWYSYLLIKDAFGSGFKVAEPMPRVVHQAAELEYQRADSTSMNFYLERLTGTKRVFEYKLRAVRPGSYSNGVATIQCLYTPEVFAQSAESRMTIN